MWRMKLNLRVMPGAWKKSRTAALRAAARSNGEAVSLQTNALFPPDTLRLGEPRSGTWILSIALRVTPLLCAAVTCLAQVAQKPSQPDDLAQSVEQWMRDNLDDSVLDALGQIDQDRVRQFFTELQRRFQGTSLYEIGSLKEVASRLLPVLQQFEETQPYGAWLQAHLDYFDTSDQLRQQAKPPPPVKPGVPPPLPAPSLQLQRTVWTRQLERRPLPPLAQNYVPRLKQIFSAERTPPELVWLDEVESSFDPKALSPAGAAGLFQLMPVTARTLNLSSWPRDERFQPEKSAHAAAQYLRSLHSHYGDWRLALAAYNAGGTRVDNLLKKYNGHSYESIASHLPAETQMYVPKVEATLRRREGIALAELKLPRG